MQEPQNYQEMASRAQPYAGLAIDGVPITQCPSFSEDDPDGTGYFFRDELLLGSAPHSLLIDMASDEGVQKTKEAVHSWLTWRANVLHDSVEVRPYVFQRDGHARLVFEHASLHAESLSIPLTELSWRVCEELTAWMRTGMGLSFPIQLVRARAPVDVVWFDLGNGVLTKEIVSVESFRVEAKTDGSDLLESCQVAVYKGLTERMLPELAERGLLVIMPYAYPVPRPQTQHALEHDIGVWAVRVGVFPIMGARGE